MLLLVASASKGKGWDDPSYPKTFRSQRLFQLILSRNSDDSALPEAEKSRYLQIDQDGNAAHAISLNKALNGRYYLLLDRQIIRVYGGSGNYVSTIKVDAGKDDRINYDTDEQGNVIAAPWNSNKASIYNAMGKKLDEFTVTGDGSNFLKFYRFSKGSVTKRGENKPFRTIAPLAGQKLDLQKNSIDDLRYHAHREGKKLSLTLVDPVSGKNKFDIPYKMNDVPFFCLYGMDTEQNLFVLYEATGRKALPDACGIVVFDKMGKILAAQQVVPWGFGDDGSIIHLNTGTAVAVFDELKLTGK
jgi:hypothetical protein